MGAYRRRLTIVMGPISRAQQREDLFQCDLQCYQLGIRGQDLFQAVRQAASVGEAVQFLIFGPGSYFESVFRPESESA